MIHQEIHLNQYYSLDFDPILEVNIENYLDVDFKKQELSKAMLILPGGGYSFCSKREGDPIASSFMDAGYACFTLWYTVKQKYPVPQKEVMAAVDYMKKHSEELRIHPDKIAVIGFSAGGHLAASYGMLFNDPELKKSLKLVNSDTSVKALVLSYPVITMGKDTHEGTKEVITGNDPKLIEKLSVEKHVTSSYPPTFLWATKEDKDVPCSNTIMMKESLRKAHVKYQCVLYPHLGHGLSLATEQLNSSNYSENKKEFDRIASWSKKADSFLKYSVTENVSLFFDIEKTSCAFEIDCLYRTKAMAFYLVAPFVCNEAFSLHATSATRWQRTKLTEISSLGIR